MMTTEGDTSRQSALFEDVLHITADAASSSVSSPPQNRFIVEPQVLNAALEVEGRKPPAVLPRPSRTVPAGGLPPPPRPNSQKGRPPRSTPSSPATSGDHSIASLPNSPLSSPYSNSPDTPANSDGGYVRPSPRLSNILSPESLLFNSLRRRSMVEQDALWDGDNAKEAESPTVSPWSPREQPEEQPLASPQGSFQSSLPSSPEMAPTPVDGSRPSRQNRYLTGLQKITKLGKSKSPINMFGDTGVRNSRRMSDAELDPRRSQKKGSSGSEDLSSRYRRMLDKGVKTAGELIKPSSSVPSSPVSPSVKNMVLPGERDRHGRSVDESQPGTRVGEGARRGGFTVAGVSGTGSVAGGAQPASATRGSAVASFGGASQAARGSPSVAASPRVWLSHARQASDMSSSSLAHSSHFSPSESSHEPPSVTTEPRISISSTIYSDSPNSHSLDIPRPAMSPDRESFIDLASPTFSPRAAEFQFIGIPPTSQSPHTEQPMSASSRKSSDSQYGRSFSQSSSPSSSSAPSSKPRLARLVPPTPDKPPIPTAPKPDFSYRSRSANRSSPVQSKKPSPLSSFAADLDPSLPTFSASNALTPRERADRIRTTRKLQQVFGQPPGVSPVSQEPQELTVPNGCMPIPGPLTLNLSAKRRHQHRPAVSMSDDVANTTPVYDAAGDMLWPPPDGTRYVTLAPRRHSAPLSPDEFSFMRPRRSQDTDVSGSMASVCRDASSVIEIGTAEGAPDSDAASSVRSRRGRSGAEPGSPTSFMDLSDEEGPGDAVETPKASRGRSPPFSPSTASLVDSLSSDQQAEEERRRKREKLAKLHRFLGSRVPPHLVLGPLDEGTPLPPPAPSPFDRGRDIDIDDEDGGDIRKAKMRRRRSSSAAEFSRKWSDDIDRLKEELNEREKAINVRRAVKMEKMFGVAPPQTLYHTRAPVSSSPNISTNVWLPSPSTSRASPKSPPTPPFRFTTTGPSTKAKSKKRPGTGDSSKPLMDDHRSSDGFLDAGQSSVYMHYRHSLNSLNDIIDRDDKESLAELHDYITGDHYKTGEQYDYQFGGALGSTSRGPSAASPLPDEFVVTTPTTTKAERRRSLPSRVSIASFTSEISMIIAPTPTDAAFQQRRRRAAKLTHFFGVDYRDLMGEILDSIEKGLEEERGKGTLKPDEVKDLQQKLVSLKSKRNSLSR